jgi:hypothetical protein
MRWAVGIITFFFVISAIFLYFVDVKQGYIEALNFHMTAEVELVEAKLKDPSIRVEEEDLSPEELEKRAIETRAIIAKVSKQDLDQPGVLTSAKTKIGALKADDDIVEQHLDLSKEPADLFTPARVGTDAARRGGAGGVRGGGGGGGVGGARARRAHRHASRRRARRISIWMAMAPVPKRERRRASRTSTPRTTMMSRSVAASED